MNKIQHLKENNHMNDVPYNTPVYLVKDGRYVYDEYLIKTKYVDNNGIYVFDKIAHWKLIDSEIFITHHNIELDDSGV